MKTRVVLVIALVVFCAQFVSAEDRRADKDNLTVMTLNTYWMWDGVQPEDGTIKEMPPWRGAKSKAEEHMSKIAELIKKVNPDILNVVEVENLDALKTLSEKFLKDLNYKAYLIEGEDSATGQDVGLLTRIDPVDGDIRRDGRKGQSGNVKKSVAKNYIAEFDIGNKKIALIGLHLLAIPGSEGRKLKREAQADAIRWIAVDVLKKGYLPIILGDFNDYDGDDGARDHIDSIPISKVLRIVKEMDPSNADDDLVNVARKVDKKKRYTSWWDKNENGIVDKEDSLTSIDHVLLPKVLFERITDVQIPQDHDPSKVTDHFPIVVRLKLVADQ